MRFNYTCSLILYYPLVKKKMKTEKWPNVVDSPLLYQVKVTKKQSANCNLHAFSFVSILRSLIASTWMLPILEKWFNIPIQQVKYFISFPQHPLFHYITHLQANDNFNVFSRSRMNRKNLSTVRQRSLSGIELTRKRNWRYRQFSLWHKTQHIFYFLSFNFTTSHHLNTKYALEY